MNLPVGLSVFAVGAAALVILTLAAGVKIVPQGYVYTVERFGRYARSLGAGLALIVPFVERVLKPNMMKQATNEDAVTKALDKDLPPLFDYLEGEIAGPYLVGDAFSIADISVVTGFYNFHLAEAQIDAARWPKLAAYVADTLARPSFKTALDAKKG